jgi:Methyladenine glycosylase
MTLGGRSPGQPALPRHRMRDAGARRAAPYERISLEAFQAGLSWLTILIKRPAFRAAFDNFDPEIVARYTDDDIERLMNNKAIVRNRARSRPPALTHGPSWICESKAISTS